MRLNTKPKKGRTLHRQTTGDGLKKVMFQKKRGMKRGEKPGGHKSTN